MRWSRCDPAYRLLLEVIRIRWERHETLPLLAAAHIAPSTLPCWPGSASLGHAGDPSRLRSRPSLLRPRQPMGHIDDRGCPHSKAGESGREPGAPGANVSPSPGWRDYLDRQHSVVSHALATCATDCPYPCTVMTRFDRTISGQS